MFCETRELRDEMLNVSSEPPRTQPSIRYHRTIPKHLTQAQSDDLSQTMNKKAFCQCPIQHIPSSYMGSHLNNQSSKIFLSTLTTKLNNVAMKQHKNITPPSYTTTCDTQSSRTSKPNLLKLEAAHPYAIGVLKHANTKKNEAYYNEHDNNKLQSDVNNSGKLSTLNSNPLLLPYPLTIETLSKTVEPYPILPPKLYKNSTRRLIQHASGSYYSNSKTHKISRHTENSQFSILLEPSDLTNIKDRHVKGNKTLPKSDFDTERQSISYNKQFKNNTLPKNSKKHCGISITEVVSKVPSIITLPHSSLTAQPQSKLAFEMKSFNKISSSCEPKTPILENEQPYRTFLRENVNIKFYDVPNTEEKLTVLTTSVNRLNSKQQFLPNDTSLDEDYLSECENCKSSNGLNYYLAEEELENTMETMTLQRKIPDSECEEQQNYYSLPTSTNKKQP